jgi:hypothetical protein
VSNTIYLLFPSLARAAVNAAALRCHRFDFHTAGMAGTSAQQPFPIAAHRES